jgi:hypothetical protein
MLNWCKLLLTMAFYGLIFPASIFANLPTEQAEKNAMTINKADLQATVISFNNDANELQNLIHYLQDINPEKNKELIQLITNEKIDLSHQLFKISLADKQLAIRIGEEIFFIAFKSTNNVVITFKDKNLEINTNENLQLIKDKLTLFLNSETPISNILDPLSLIIDDAKAANLVVGENIVLLISVVLYLTEKLLVQIDSNLKTPDTYSQILIRTQEICNKLTEIDLAEKIVYTDDGRSKIEKEAVLVNELIAKEIYNCKENKENGLKVLNEVEIKKCEESNKLIETCIRPKMASIETKKKLDPTIVNSNRGNKPETLINDSPIQESKSAPK